MSKLSRKLGFSTVVPFWSAMMDGFNDGRYRLTHPRTLVRRALGLLPSAWRQPVAERFLRRPDAPGPALEHVVQYLFSAAKPTNGERKGREATVAKGADNFYGRQYRQYLNATMGAFAMTATQVLVASGGAPRGWLWRRHRRTYAALLEQLAGAPPLLVLDHQTVAVPLRLPQPNRQEEQNAIQRWLAGRGSQPESYRNLIAGEEVRSADPAVHARERSADGALLEVVDALLGNRQLALLALHPHDPGAMGLHITLFGIEVVGPERLEQDYGLDATVLDAHRDAAQQTDRLLVFCVGGTEEVFTQCSQNLFIKRPATRSTSTGPAGQAEGLGPNAASGTPARHAIRDDPGHRFRERAARRLTAQRRSGQSGLRRAQRPQGFRSDSLSSGQCGPRPRGQAVVQPLWYRGDFR